jgi:hypothetical protein
MSHNVRIVFESDRLHEDEALMGALDKVEAFLSTFIEGAEGLYGPDVWGSNEPGYRTAQQIFNEIAFHMEGEASP